MVRRCYEWLNDLLHRPLRVFWFCFACGAAGIILDGGALRLWGLHRDHKVLEAKIAESEKRASQLAFRIQEAQQPEFIERAARDQFDFVKEGDLIFIFSEDSAELQEKVGKTGP